ncbi:hypothetical protein NFIA_024070 [Paecilomyces variotii No. 5]|uniref:Uncharacterized protein n=1 Tax=Byssochlamys spectabilis (strain No. 5 / NBRC 109023) TaxID=1356009 RepID=V5I5Q8_BYSSN|nr:hypothetical protein NFIA_024070 [Paecilomyces variotii No. 5]
MDGPPPNKRRRTDSSPVAFPSWRDIKHDAGKLVRFVAIVNVARLSPHWGHGIAANRPLENSRVEDILQSFSRDGVRRFEKGKRLRVSMPRQIIHEILGNTFNRKEKELARHHHGRNHYDYDYPILDLSARAFHKAYVRLEDGQHRRAAVMRFCGLHPSDTRGIFSPDPLIMRTLKSTMWTIDVFEMEALDEQPLSRYVVRNEEISFQRIGYHGYMFCVFSTLWDGLTQEQRHNAKLICIQYSEMMNGTSSDYALWPHPGGCFLHHVTCVCDWFETVIGSVADRIDPADMEVLIKESQDFTSSRLRPLFFPVLDDFILGKNRVVRGNVSYLDVNWMLGHPGQQPAWPTMRDAFSGDSGHFYRYRRPQFLRVLSGQEYRALYSRLLRSRTIFPVPQWEAMAVDARQVGMLTHWILYHMVRWFKPDFNVLDRDRDSGFMWSWDEVVRDYVISRRSKPFCDSLSAAALVEKVIGICRKYRDRLDLSELKHLIESSASESEHDRDLRFSKDPWNRLLMIAWEYTDGGFPSTGHFAQYRDRHKISELFFRAECTGSLERLVAVNNSELQHIFGLFGTASEGLEQKVKAFGALYMHWILEKLRPEENRPIETYPVISDRRLVVERSLERYREMISTLDPNAASLIERDQLLPQIQPPEDSLSTSDGDIPLVALKPSHVKSSQKPVCESDSSGLAEKSRPESSPPR